MISEPVYHTIKYFSEDLLATEMKKMKVKMNKPIYSAMSILDISKTLMYDFWYDYIKPKNQDNAKLCYIDILTSLLFILKLKIFMKILQIMLKKRFDTSNCDDDVDIALPKGMNKKVIGLMKDELRGKIMTEFVALRQKKRILNRWW